MESRSAKPSKHFNDASRVRRRDGTANAPKRAVILNRSTWPSGFWPMLSRLIQQSARGGSSRPAKFSLPPIVTPIARIDEAETA
jgi:hypothetical protein